MNNKNKVWTIIFKVFIILLFAFVVFLVCYDFFDTSKSYFTTEILIALCLAFVIVCIDLFDSFQIGNILNIKRENKNLKEQNESLTKIIANINNTVCVNNYAEVKQSTDEDKLAKLEKENKENNISSFDNNPPYKTEELKIINEYIDKYGFNNATIIRDAKLDLMNPLMRGALFDLDIKQGNQEQFIEVKHLVPSMYNYAYIEKQLLMVAYYNKIKNANAQYVLIIKAEMMEGNNKIAKLNKQKFEKIKEMFNEPIEKGVMIIISL